MKIVVAGTTIGTGTMVLSSYASTNIQLASVMLASLLGSLVALYVFRSAKFDRLEFLPIFCLALALHLLALLGNPLLEDDYFRYLWDAFRFANDGTPYGPAPSAYFGDVAVPPAFQEILNFINYPDIPTIYGPVLQALFMAGYAIAPGKVVALQGLNLVIALSTLALLARCGAKPRWLLLYAISPLVLKEATITAHPDALTGLLALAAFAVGGPLCAWLAGGLMGLAVASKVSVVLLLPFLWVRGGMRAFAAAGITLIACYAPFFWLAGSDMPTLSQFAQNWRFNPLFYGALDWLAGPTNGRFIAAAAIITMTAILYWRDARAGLNRAKIPPADYALGALLVLSPVVNPWYLLWLLPFAVLRPSRTAWTATFLIPLSYWNGTNQNLGSAHEFDVPIIVTLIEIAGLTVAAYYDWVRPLTLPQAELGNHKQKAHPR